MLEAGGLVAVPTDTVYGIAVALATPGGLERLFAAKGRPPDKAIALLLADAAQAGEIGEMTDAAHGPRRRVLAGRADACGASADGRPLPAALTGGDSPRRVRRSASASRRTMRPGRSPRLVGPLPTTSANRSGEPEARDAGEIEQLLGDAVDLILDGGPATRRPRVDRRRLHGAGPSRSGGPAPSPSPRSRAASNRPGLPGVGR